MSEKKTRLDVLRILLQNNAYDSQESLLDDLRKEGFHLAQPTLSRDLHQLKVSKVFDDEGKYIYALHGSFNANSVSGIKRPKERMTQSFGFLSVDFSGNMVVLKTLHGYANSLAAEIDENTVPEILGSLAGDDTVLLVLREGASRDVVYDMLRNVIPRFDD